MVGGRHTNQVTERVGPHEVGCGVKFKVRIELSVPFQQLSGTVTEQQYLPDQMSFMGGAYCEWVVMTATNKSYFHTEAKRENEQIKKMTGFAGPFEQ